MSLSAVILAGGKSSRMGEDKALMPFGGYKTLAEYQFCKLSKIFHRVYISTKESKFSFDAPLILDNGKDSSPLNAIVSIYEYLGNKPFFLLCVDMPLIEPLAIKELVQLYKTTPHYASYLFKSRAGLEPTAAIYTDSLLESAKRNYTQKRLRLKDLIQSKPYKLLEYPNDSMWINVNTKEEYMLAKKLAVKKV